MQLRTFIKTLSCSVLKWSSLPRTPLGKNPSQTCTNCVPIQSTACFPSFPLSPPACPAFAYCFSDLISSFPSSRPCQLTLPQVSPGSNGSQDQRPKLVFRPLARHYTEDQVVSLPGGKVKVSFLTSECSLWPMSFFFF